MDPINIAVPDFSYDESDPEHYRCGMHRIGKQLGLTSLGASVYEIAPGQSLCPYHYEYGEQEALLVLQGRPTLRRPQGTQVLEPWDSVGFPTGPTGAHKVSNDSDETPSTRSSGPTAKRRFTSTTVLRALRCSIMTPLGRPVDPDVKMLMLFRKEAKAMLAR